MDAPIPLNSARLGPSPGEQAQLRWLPRVNFIVAALALLWMIPSYWIVSGMFADLPMEIRPSSPLIPLLTAAIPGVAGLCLVVAGTCLARQRGYVACMVASALTVFGGPLLVLGIINIIFLTRPAVKALFQRNAR